MGSKEENELSEVRTKFSEDRTLFANERTFAGWMRTGLASVGVGVGFHVLFSEIDPTYVAKAISSILILIGIFIFITAQMRSTNTRDRLNSNEAEATSIRDMKIICWSFVSASVGVMVSLWFLY